MFFEDQHTCKTASKTYLKLFFGGLLVFTTFANLNGGLAQLARALAWHARGHRFDSDILHR